MLRRLALIFIFASMCYSVSAQRFVVSVNNLSSLALFPLPNINTNAYVVSGVTQGDNLGGLFSYDSDATDATNATTIIKPVSTGGRWFKTIPQASALSLTEGFIPYAFTGSTLTNSPLYVIATNKLGFNATNQFFFYDGNGNQSAGFNSLDSISGGSTEGTAFGYLSLTSNTGGDANTAFGHRTIHNNLTGSQNTAVGFDVLFSNIDGNDNVGVGANALILATNAISNTAVGVNSLSSVTSGDSNAAIGTGSGNTLTTGRRNTFLGSASDVSSGTITNSIALGASAVVDASNKVKIGDGTTVLRMDMGGVSWVVGTGDPENVVTANVGSFFSRTDGGAMSSFYVKETGSGNTGWVAK